MSLYLLRSQPSEPRNHFFYWYISLHCH